MAKVRKISQTKDALSWEKARQGFLFWKQAQGLSERTLLDYRKHITQFFSRFPDCWQDGTMKESIMEYMSDGIMPATYNLRLIYLKAFFNWCMDEGILSENYLKVFKKRKAQPRIVDISEDTLKKLLELPDQSTFSGLRDYALLLFTLDTGIRPKEALSLTIADFDLDRSIIIIPASEAKTRKMRILPFLPATAKVLSKLVNARHLSWGKDIPVFCSYAGTPLNAVTWGDRLELYSERLGVKIHPYALRHCFALMFLRNGGNAFALQKMLGHEDMSMTRRYVNLTSQDLQDAHRSASPLNKLVSMKKERVRLV